MKFITSLAIASAFAALPAFAEGDVEAGEKTFKRCAACHMIADRDGNVLRKGGRQGPNLYGVAGRTAGTQADYGKYGKHMIAAGEAGLVWSEETFVPYLANPSGYLKEVLDDPKAKAKMSFRLKKGAEDVFAYLKSAGATQ